MKKADTLQLAIVIVGIIFGFLTMQYIFSSLFGIFAWIFSGGYGENYLTQNITFYAVIGLQAICCWLLIIRSGKLAVWLYEKAELSNNFKIVSNVQSLLYIVLVAIGIYLLLSNLNLLASTILENFRNRVSNSVTGQQDQRPVEWIRLVMDIVLPGILLIFAKPIAGYFAKNIGEEPVIIEELFDNKEEIIETKAP
jgi:hypothetical protein